MKDYYIYKLNEVFISYAKKYPQSIHQMARKNTLPFDKEQHQFIFLDHNEVNTLLKEVLNKRNDYICLNHTHYIRNQITGESCLLKVYDFGIYLRCSTKFDILKNIILQSDSNYVILDR